MITSCSIDAPINDCFYVHFYLAGEDDFHVVYEEVASLCADYYKLGVGLRLPPAELQTIRKSCGQDVMQAFTEILLAWLRQQYDVKKYGLPNWRMLVKVVNNPAFGNNPALAKRIADKHRSDGEIFTALVHCVWKLYSVPILPCSNHHGLVLCTYMGS